MNNLSIEEFKEVLLLLNKFLIFSEKEYSVTNKAFRCFWYAEMAQDIVSSLPNISKPETEYRRIYKTLNSRSYKITNQLKMLLDLRTDIVHGYQLINSLMMLEDKNINYFDIAFKDLLDLINYVQKYFGVNEIVDTIQPSTKEFIRLVHNLEEVNVESNLQKSRQIEQEVAITCKNDNLLNLCVKELLTLLPPSLLNQYNGDTQEEKLRCYLIEKYEKTCNKLNTF